MTLPLYIDDSVPYLRILQCGRRSISGLALDKDVLVVAWGEFGRTPVVNDKAGRDHWPQVQSALVIGGGLKMGQVIGVTDHLAGEPIERPVHVHEVIATIYDHCGINTQETQLVDPNGRPRYLLDYLKPIQELG